MSETAVLRPGDLFASQLPNGQFGAIKILQTRPGCALIAVSKWTGDSLPSLATPGISQLTSGLTAGPLHLRSKYEAAWYPGAPSDDVAYIGNLPLTEEEGNYDTPNCANGWHPFMAALVLVREMGMPADELWRLIREVSPARGAERAPTPMPLARFWKLIEQTKPCEDECTRLTDALAQLSPTTIRSFQERLARCLWRIDGPEHAFRGGERNVYLSPDGFLYRRCWVVGQGRELYEQVAEDPTRTPKEGECEDLISAAPEALARVEGLDDEVLIPTSVSFETYSNTSAWEAAR